METIHKSNLSKNPIYNLQILKESGIYFDCGEVEIRYEDLEENCIVETTRKWYKTKLVRYVNIKGRRYYIDNKYRYRIDIKGDDFDFSNLRVKYYDYKVAELAYQADVFADLSKRIYRESGCDRKAVALRIQKQRLAPIGFLALNSEERGREILARQPIRAYCKYIPDYKPERLGAVFYGTYDGEIGSRGKLMKTM